MYITFSKHKANYKKGQLTPFFIALIAVLIIAVFVTINAGKISLFKTHTANAADAGALAGGSVMASVFNTQSVMNSQMIVQYQMFMAEMGVLLALFAASLLVAVVSCVATGCCSCCGYGCPCDCCCPSLPCGRASRVAITTMKAMIASTSAAWVAQIFYFEAMRKQAKEGRDSAIETAYRYSFINSGIGNKLVPGNIPVDAGEIRGDNNNYLDTFNDWIKTSEVTSGHYKWLDGQSRGHWVQADVQTDDVNEYKLKVSILPVPVVLAGFGVAWDFANAIPVMCICCLTNSGAIAAISAKAVALASASYAGLAPGFIVSSNNPLTYSNLICRADDIVHDRKVKVTTWQAHQGEDYGLWRTKYPSDWDGQGSPSSGQRIESRSLVDFDGHGKIHPPKAEFDAKIIAIDKEVN